MLFPTKSPATRRPFAHRVAAETIHNMCKAADGKADALLPSGRALSSVLPSFALLQPPYSKRKIVVLVFLASILLGTAAFASLYTFHRGFRRTVQFWRGLAPLIVKYKALKFKAEKIDKCSEDELQRRLDVYREASAPKLVDLILQMGGIYIKIGQDGVPPRTYAEISRIIVEDSTGKRMDELFSSFEEKPIGAASVAQVHRATLRPKKEGEEPMPIVLKVQYPEVAELFEADLSNLETATRLFAKENMEVAKALRKRHENELDFTKEADNLRECTRDMQKYGMEPSLEQDSVAKALGKKDGDELKKVLASRMREHFENGGGAGSGGMMMLGDKRMKLLNVLGPSATAVLRTYASVRDGIENAALSVAKFGSKLRAGLKQDEQDIIADGTGKKRKVKVNLGRALKTLVHVHGIQLLLSGTYNADPHPGNVLILPDGRLGLLDYGMVGRLSETDRETVSRTILALSDRDKAATAKLYRENGYKVSFRDGSTVDDAVLHRFARFHLDGIDLSPLTLDNGETVDTLELLRNTRELTVPSWVEEGRRLGGLLVGVNAQAARPISLSKEWRPIAKEALRRK